MRLTQAEGDRDQPLQYQAQGGEHLGESIRNALAIAQEYIRPVELIFNGEKLLIEDTSNPKDVEVQFLREMQRKAEEWEESEEGIAYHERARVRQEKIKEDHQKPLIAPTLKNEEVWKESVQVNSVDKMGIAIIRYAARWARMMEEKMAAGAKLEDIAESLDHEADLEGMSGATFGLAFALLRDTWIHGDELGAIYEKRFPGMFGRK